LKAEDPDIFVCQEIKCEKAKLPPKAELKNYHCYWLPADKPGYSGVGLMSKLKPIKVSYGISEHSLSLNFKIFFILM
jgi:exonuclease III